MVEKYDVDGVTLLNTPEEEREKKFISIYKKKITPRGYGGDFYDSDSFYRYADKVFEQLKKLIADKADWERTQKSLEYLSLDPEAKQNVMDEFSYLDEEIVETLSRYDAAISMANILVFYEKEYGIKAVAYMYGD